jgi:hypothetical protein
VLDEVALGQPDKALLVGDRLRQRGRRGPLAQQPAEGLALVQPEGRDIDQGDRIGGVGTERGHDLAAIRMPGHDGGPVLEIKDMTQPRHVIS